jgi:hypothetical protein
MAYIKVLVRNQDTGESFPMEISDTDPVPVIASGFVIDKSPASIRDAQKDAEKRMYKNGRRNRLFGSVLVR